MSERERLLSLAEQCEKATGPDRELDADIAVTVHGGEIVWLTANYTMEQYPARKYESANHVQGFGKAPVDAVTSSLDAAVALVPQEHCYSVAHNMGPNPKTYWMFRASCCAHDAAVMIPRPCLAALPALALTAAALRARAEQADA